MDEKNFATANQAGGLLTQALRLRLADDPDGALAALEGLREDTRKAYEGTAFGQIMQIVSQNEATAESARVYWLLDAGREENAREAAKKALELLEADPVLAAILPNTRYTFALQFGDWEAALEALDEIDAAVEARPQSLALNQYFRWLILERLGRAEDARVALETHVDRLEAGLGEAHESQRAWWIRQLVIAFRPAPAAIRDRMTARVLELIAEGQEQAVQAAKERRDAAPPANKSAFQAQVQATIRNWQRFRATTLTGAGRHGEALAIYESMRPLRSPVAANVVSLAGYAVSLAARGREADARRAAERVLLVRDTAPWTERDLASHLVYERARRVLRSLAE